MDNVLFAQLRKLPSPPEAKRVEKILDLLVSAAANLEHSRSPVTTFNKAEFLAEVKKRSDSKYAYLQSLDRLTTALKRYKWRSEMIGNVEGFSEELASTGARKDPMAVWEHAIVRVLLNRLRIPGEIAKVRRCKDCQNWFYAATAHQQFCGDACRRRHTASSPEFKEKRRRYMQQTYRPQQKEREMESRALAKRVATKRKGN